MSRQTIRKAHNFTAKLNQYMSNHDITEYQGTVCIVIIDVQPDEVEVITNYASSQLNHYPIEFTKAYRYNKHECEITFYIHFIEDEFS
jgi:hypothetical protein